MIDKKRQISITNKVATIFKNNIKTIIFLISSFFLVFIFYQYYLNQKENKVLELSILFDQAKSNINSNDFEETMNSIAKENGIYGILASLELIKKTLDNKDYNYAYNQYLILLKDNESKSIYNSIIALHGAYNLIDYVSSNNISNLLIFVDESHLSFIGYRDEVDYLLSIKNNDFTRREELSKKILNNGNISETIKERVRKLNEFEKYQ